MFGISTSWGIPGIRQAALLGVGVAVSLGIQAASGVALEAVRRLKGTDLSANPALRQAVEKVARDLRGEPEHLELVRDFQLTGELPAVAQFVAARPADPAALDGVRLLLTPESRPLLEKALESSADRARLLELLGHSGSREAVPLLKGWAVGPDRTSARAAMVALAGSHEGARELLTLLRDREKGRPAEWRPVAIEALEKVRWEEIRREALALRGNGPAAAAPGLPPVAELMARRGDPRRGRSVFERPTTGCSSCHQVHGQGADLGPNLSEIGSKLGRDALYDSILQPSAGIAFGYEAWVLTLKGGDEVYGLIASETAGEIAVKQQGGASGRYRQDQVVRREKQ
ncbi:MAG: c-type cytochrome, partial [Verrucomicrobiota bacterium]